MLGPFGGFGQLVSCECWRVIFAGAAAEKAVLADCFSCALHLLRALNAPVDHGDHLRAMGASAIEGAGLDQAFEHALIEEPRVDGFAEFEEAA